MLKARGSTAQADFSYAFTQPDPNDTDRWKDLAAVNVINADAVKTVREAAGKWQTALTGITALVGITAAVGGRDALQKLDNGWAGCITVGIIVVLLISATAAYLAQLASSGLPIFQPLTTPGQVAEYADNPLAQAEASRKRLGEAGIATLIGFVLSLVLLVMIWFAPEDEKEQPDPVDVTVTNSGTGTKVIKCVAMTPADDPSFVMLTDATEQSKADQDNDVPRIIKVRALATIVMIEPGSC